MEQNKKVDTANVVALGAESKTTFSVMSPDGALYVSEPAGDITSLDGFDAFLGALKKHMMEKDLAPGFLACDLHPDYVSSRLAERMRRENGNARLVKVQHHFAHIVSCMMDNDIDEEVTGVSFDGTGYGDDGATWGGEVITCTRQDFKRRYHLKYLPQPGGDAASREAWRMGVSYLREAYGADFADAHPSFTERVGKDKVAFVSAMAEKGVNAPLTSSAGRLFDAVSSITGICDASGFEAEAAILLERAAREASGVEGYYAYDIKDGNIDLTGMIRRIVDEVNDGEDVRKISARFHNTLAEIVFDAAGRISGEFGIRKVMISGGCFQNAYLVDRIEKRFRGSAIALFKHRNLSPTDLGISVGQAAIAARNIWG